MNVPGSCSSSRLKMRSSRPDVLSPQNPYATVQAKKDPVPSQPSLTKGLTALRALAPLKLKSESATRISCSARSAGHATARNDFDLTFEEDFDRFLLSTLAKPLADCVEELFLEQLTARHVTFWSNIPSLHVLYSKKKKTTISRSNGLVGYTFYKREMLKLPVPSEHPAYNERYDSCPAESHMGMLLFPLWDHLGTVCAVVQVIRHKNDVFEVQKELDFIQYFTRKFGALYPFFARPLKNDEALIEMMQVMEMEQFLLVFQKKMEQIFNCRIAEIWRYDRAAREMCQWKKTRAVVPSDVAGIVGQVLEKEYPVSTTSNKMMSSYCEPTDGREEEPVLVIPKTYLRRNIVYAVCLRGGKKVPAFSADDEYILAAILPFLALAVDNLENTRELATKDAKTDSVIVGGSKENAEHQVIDGLIKIVDMITTKADLEQAIQVGVEKMGLITRADKSTWYRVDKSTMNLQTLFCTAKDMKADVTSSRTIPARVFATHEVFNIADAYEDIEFDSSVDLETNYRTTSLLAIPVVNKDSDVVGVMEFCNRLDGEPFPNAVIPYIRILSTFVCLMIDYDRLQKAVFDSSQKLRSFLSISMALSTDSCLQMMHTDILHNIRKECRAESGAIYLLNSEKMILASFVADGEKIQRQLPLNYGIASLAFKAKDAVISNDCESDPRMVKDPLDLSGVVLKNLCIVPIVSFSGDVFGVVEVANKTGNFGGEECEKIRSLALFVAISLETRGINEVTEHGNVSFEMNRWIEELEKPELGVPDKLKIVTRDQIEVQSIYFDCFNWSGIELIKIVFQIFVNLNLVSLYKMDSETLFSFIYKVREAYSLDLCYHNFARAVDQLQFLGYEIKLAKIGTRLTNGELLALVIACLCMGAGYEEKREFITASGEVADRILNPDKSTTTTRSCAVAIKILSNQESNILKNLNETELKDVWNWVILLITNTDMIYHFKILGIAERAQKEDKVSWTDHGQKLANMTLLLKAASVAQICRPDDICERWHLLVREELQLDKQYETSEDFLESIETLEKATRDHRMRDQMTYADLIAMPILKAVVGFCPNLSPIYNAAESNLQRWKDNFFVPPEPVLSTYI